MKTRKQQAMLLFLAADAVMFFSLFAAYIYLRRTALTWPTVFHFPSSLMAFAMTMFAVSASFTVAVAARQRNDLIAIRCVVASIGAWLCFVFIEAIEWARLIFFQGVTLRSGPFGASFYTLSGLHVAHVIAGLVYLTMVAIRIRRYDVGACALYVHFVNLMWLLLFPALYLSAADLQGL